MKKVELLLVVLFMLYIPRAGQAQYGGHCGSCGITQVTRGTTARASRTTSRNRTPAVSPTAAALENLTTEVTKLKDAINTQSDEIRAMHGQIGNLNKGSSPTPSTAPPVFSVMSDKEALWWLGGLTVCAAAIFLIYIRLLRKKEPKVTKIIET